MSESSLPMRSRLLVADDDQEQLAEISEYLERSGFDVVTAHDGFHALELAAEHRPRVIMLDVNMPGWDGVRVADAMRNLDHRAIIILMTIIQRIVMRDRKTLPRRRRFRAVPPAGSGPETVAAARVGGSR